MATHDVTRGGVAQLDKSKSRARCRKWMLSCRVDGVRRMRRFTGAYTEAVDELERWRVELAGAVECADTLSAYMARWHAWRCESGDYAPGTLANDLRAIRAVERSPLACKRMDEITPVDVRDALAWIKSHPVRSRKPLSGTTMNKTHNTLSQIFTQAADDGLIAQSPMAHMSAPRTDTRERDALSIAQIAYTLDTLDAMELDGHVVAVHLMLTLGLRRGEALALHVDDIARDCVHIRRAIKERDGSIGVPKSPASVRTLPLPNRTRALISRWMDERDARGLAHATTLCCNGRGGVLRPHQMQKWWNANRERIGCAGMVMHQLRHSNLSMMARHMPSAFDLQKWAGWSSLEPARVYIHIDTDALANAVTSAFAVLAVTPRLHINEAGQSAYALTCDNLWSGGQDLNLRPDVCGDSSDGSELARESDDTAKPS